MILFGLKIVKRKERVMNKMTTIYQFAREYAYVMKKPLVSEITFVKYEIKLKWINALLKNKKIEGFNLFAAQEFINKYSENHSTKTVREMVFFLKNVFEEAIEEDITEKNPFKRVKVPKTEGNRQKTKLKYLNVNEFEKLTNNLRIRKDDWDIKDIIIYFLLKTGTRYAEMAGLTWDCVDFKSRTIKINKTLDYKNNRGFMPTKNTMSIRTINVDRHLLSVLSILKENRFYKSNKFNLVFFSKKTAERKRKNNQEYGVPHNSTLNNYLEYKLKMLGLPVISIHGFRHTHISYLLYKNVDKMVIAKRVGHADTKMIDKTYGHILKELQERETEKIIAAMEGF